MPDPIAMLEQDHRRVEQLFEQYADGQDPLIAQQICTELTVHAELEEAEREHDEVKQLIAQSEQKGYDAPSVPELILKIEEGVSHHVEEEESEIFPKMRQALDQQTLEQIGQKATQTKQQLMQQVQGGQPQGSSVEGELTKEELYQKAKEQDIEGRSKMDKDELQKALGEQ